MAKLLGLCEKYKGYVNIGSIVGVLMLIYYGILQSLIVNILTLIYLTYNTIKLIEEDKSHETLDKKVKKQNKMMKQWTCYSSYLMIESVGDIFFKIFPFGTIYYFAKLIIFMWLIKSDENLDKLYSEWVLTYYTKYKSTLRTVCNIMEKLSESYRDKIDTYISNNYVYIKKAIFGYIEDLIRDKIIDKDEDLIKLLDIQDLKDD
jgi:hypothetical protein